MLVDLDNRNLMTITDITPDEARTMMKALSSAIDLVESAIIAEDESDRLGCELHHLELERLRSIATRIGFYTVRRDGKRAETVGDILRL